ncbi:DNA polymerase [Paenibacillus xylanexedens]|uniref:DNA polymerase n=1 Tax=Paenibacillus xylanexedens TaxID=528191 RepID=UPI0011A62BEB|nr:DNA polymerase [Paenibacillus xylanexedens]
MSNLDVLAVIKSADEKAVKKKERAAKAATEKPKTPKKKAPTKKQLQIGEMARETTLPDHYTTVWTKEELRECVEWLEQQPVIAVDTETMGLNPFADPIVGISFYAPHRGFYIPLRHIEHIERIEDVPTQVFDDEGHPLRPAILGVDYVRCLPLDLVIRKLRHLLEDRSKKFLFHNAKFDMHVIRENMDIHIVPYFDSAIGQALLDENQSKRLKDIATLYLKIPADTFGKLFGKTTFDKVPILVDLDRRGNLASYYAIKDTELTYKMVEFQAKAMKRPGLEEVRKLMFDVEMPFVQIVARAEARGVKLDIDYLENRVAVDLQRDVEELRQKIFAYTGDINLNAPAQVAEAIYVKIGLPRVNDDKPNSTDKGTLGKLKKKHPVIPFLMDYKQKIKLATAFANKLPKSVVEGRVHTSFNPTGTKTGRMSCNSPNLQQIPTRVGGLIRNAFIADNGRLLASVDFSQQEIRWLAHVSGDKVLLDVYKSGKDVHSMTAVSMWNQNADNVAVSYDLFESRREIKELFLDEDGKVVEERFTDTDYLAKLQAEGKITFTDPRLLREAVELGIYYEKYRKNAKVVNFGILYGMSKYKLADTLEISVEEAEAYIEAYFAQYPGVKAWMNKQRKLMQSQGFTKTYLGRKRRVHKEVNSDKFWLVQRGFRQGINSVIQGSSADQVKIASILLQEFLESIDAHIVLWVHDEIIFDVPENVGNENLQKIADIMCGAVQLDCGMKSDIEVGAKWGQKMSKDAIDLLFLDDEDGGYGGGGDDDEEDAA